MNAQGLLIVEDERIVALHTKQQLQRLGYEVVAVASSGEDALEKIARLRPAIVLMDIHLEGPLDGIETAAKIPPESDVAVIYVTAYSEEATLKRARATRPYGYLIKPYSERELHATLQMAMERRRANAAVLDSEQRFRAIFDSVSEGIFIVDAATRSLIGVNESGCRMMGFTPEEIAEIDITTLSSGRPPFTAELAEAWIAKALVTDEPQRFTWQNKTKDGRVFPVEVSMNRATISGKQILLSIVRDLTEHQAIEEQLRQAQKMEAIGQLTGGMAHDFNNLLSIIIGNLEMLQEARPDDLQVSEYAGEAMEAAIGGADLTRQLLAFARRQTLQPERIDVKALVGRTAKLLTRLLGEQLEIELSFDDGPCVVIADRSQLEAALTNLATNARDAMPGGGKLMIETGTRYLDADYAATTHDVVPGDYALIEVTDTGTGMTPDVIHHIFEPFYTTKERDKGTGLGLSMVFGFLKQSGGHVTVYSEIGVGTTFRLYLPCVSGTPEKRETPSRARPSDAAGEVVLVVEDNAPLRRVAVKQLRELGYAVQEVKNGAEAVNVLTREHIDVLFTDIVMPGGMDGFELARSARKNWPGLKILLTSGYPATKLKEDLALVNFPLLSKPYGKAALARAIREILDTPGESSPVGGA